MSTTGDVLQAIFFGGSVVTIDEDIQPNVVLRETLIDTTTITQHPVETGAAITDHAYNNPAQVNLELGFGNQGLARALFGASSPAEVYQKLQDLNTARQPFDLLTTRRAYTNMLIQSMAVTADDKTKNILLINIAFQQIIIVSTSNVQLTQTKQAEPAKTTGTIDGGTKQTQPVPDSALKTLSKVFK